MKGGPGSLAVATLDEQELSRTVSRRLLATECERGLARDIARVDDMPFPQLRPQIRPRHGRSAAGSHRKCERMPPRRAPRPGCAVGSTRRRLSKSPGSSRRNCRPMLADGIHPNEAPRMVSQCLIARRLRPAWRNSGHVDSANGEKVSVNTRPHRTKRQTSPPSHFPIGTPGAPASMGGRSKSRIYR